MTSSAKDALSSQAPAPPDPRFCGGLGYGLSLIHILVGQSGLVCGVEHPDILPFLTIQGFDGRADHFAFCHIDVVLLSILIYHGAWVSAGSSQSGIVGDTLFTAAGLSDGLGSTAGAVLSDGG